MSVDETRPQRACRQDDFDGTSAESMLQTELASSQQLPPDQPMVCGRSVQGDLAYFPKAEYNGKVILFCTEFCWRAYRADPHRFFAAHRRARSGGVNQVLP